MTDPCAALVRYIQLPSWVDDRRGPPALRPACPRQQPASTAPGISTQSWQSWIYLHSPGYIYTVLDISTQSWIYLYGSQQIMFKADSTYIYSPGYIYTVQDISARGSVDISTRQAVDISTRPHRTWPPPCKGAISSILSKQISKYINMYLGIVGMDKIH